MSLANIENATPEIAEALARGEAPKSWWIKKMIVAGLFEYIPKAARITPHEASLCSERMLKGMALRKSSWHLVGESKRAMDFFEVCPYFLCNEIIDIIAVGTPTTSLLKAYRGEYGYVTMSTRPDLLYMRARYVDKDRIPMYESVIFKDIVIAAFYSVFVMKERIKEHESRIVEYGKNLHNMYAEHFSEFRKDFPHTQNIVL